MSIDQFCPIISIPQHPYIFFFILIPLILFLNGYLIKLRISKYKSLFKKIGWGFLSTILCFIAFVYLTFILTLGGFIPLDDYLPSYNFHQMNAAIKNTCLIDPLRNNCPRDLNEVIKLYPDEFKALQKNFALTYEYYPEQNNYTLIARPVNRMHFLADYRNRVAIFDQRLKNTSPYGYDFIDTESYSCGKYRLRNNPSFPGPWDKIN